MSLAKAYFKTIYIKSKYFLIILLLLQIVKSDQIHYAIKTGVPISNILYTNRVTTHIMPDKPYIWMHHFNPRAGFNFALGVDYNLGQKFYVCIEPGYLLKGAKFHDYSSSLDLHYINVPLILKYRVSDNLRLTLGSEFSKLIKANLGSIDLSDFYNKRIEISCISGFEYRFNENINFGLQLSLGLNKISETKWMDENNVVYGVVGEKSIYILPYLIYSF